MGEDRESCPKGVTTSKASNKEKDIIPHTGNFQKEDKDQQPVSVPERGPDCTFFPLSSNLPHVSVSLANSVGSCMDNIS